MLRSRYLAGAVFMAAGLGTGAAAADFRALDPARADFADLRWRARIVVVLADDAGLAAYRAQMDHLKDVRAGLAERDIVVFTDTDPAARGALARRLAQGPFTFVLIGKDGGVKRREASPVTADSLFATIDAMPMRQREMRDGD
ncbi:hypothetical protein FIU97_07790 [Roseivivax sp. THAF40]|uniref:DUF4174 domain-containing protein n=1 Tax=unclassified Roseivivax TaxID=2639302 RepID=UPI0012A7BE23|nr:MULTISPECIES: DUF4174 domain-containing protein [unclassified Roseivivax]QFS82698.1 hypothetical protein FIV09_07685 [Roseivivax sp. THAF197b]QFT46467.1 hypothetical protein FIU97_07790 [Roseivivax sp. THAF40]